MSTVKAPTNLRSWIGDSENTRVFGFTIQFDSHGIPFNYDYVLQIDNRPSFDSVNLKSYTKNNCLNFQDGNIVKAMEVVIPRRQSDDELIYYWRVKIDGGGFRSNWSDTKTFTIDKYYGKTIGDEMFSDLADEHAYSKESNSSYIYRLFSLYGRMLDGVKIERIRSARDNFKEHVRDEVLYNNFGYLVKYKKPENITYSEYRERVLTVLNASIEYSGRKQGLKDVIQVFTGEPPTILDLTSQWGWILGLNYLKDPSRPEIAPVITLFDESTKGYAFKIYIYNSWGFDLDKSVIEYFIKLLKPVHAKVYIYYPDTRTLSFYYDISDDWNTCSLVNLEINEDEDIVLGGINLSGNLTTPVMDCGENINAFGTIESSLTVPEGSDINFYIRSSFDNINWSPWEEVYNFSTPVTTPIRRYIQVRVDFSRENSSIVPKMEDLRIN